MYGMFFLGGLEKKRILQWTLPKNLENQLDLTKTGRRRRYWNNTTDIHSGVQSPSLGSAGKLGKTASAAAKDLGFNSSNLTRWHREVAEEESGRKAFTGHGIPKDEELDKLPVVVASGFSHPLAIASYGVHSWFFFGLSVRPGNDFSGLIAHILH